METLYTLKQVSEACGRGVQQMRNYRARHGLGIKVGNQWLFTTADLMQFREIVASAKVGNPGFSGDGNPGKRKSVQQA